MDASLVVTVIAPDRPGLVGVLSATVAEHGANWEASHMARLAGRFAGILLVKVASERAAELTRALENLDGLRVIVEDSGNDAQIEGNSFWVELVGSDQPNIVRRISGALAELGVTVIELSSEVADAPMAGGKLFKMQALVTAPPSVDRSRLRDALEELANSLMVDIRLDD